jgi:hypothetical protein
MASRLGQSPQGPPRAAPGPRPRAPRPQRPSGADAAVLAADDRPTRRPAGREVAEGGGSAERGRAGPRVDAPHVGDDHDRSRASAPRTSDPPPMYGTHFRTPAHRAPACADNRRAGDCSQVWGSASLVGQILWGPREHGAGSEPYEPGNHNHPTSDDAPGTRHVLCGCCVTGCAHAISSTR